MRDRAYLGIGRWMLPLPSALWRRRISSAAAGIVKANRRFMTDEHRRVHHVAVRELPRAAKPLTAERIAEGTGLPVHRVTAILDDLERRLTFLVRDDRAEITWAYPITVDATPHHVTFETGERLDAA